MYYIKGNKERGAEVIALLESKGGKCASHCCSGTDECGYYYIDKYKDICFTSNKSCIQMLNILSNELTLPEKKEWEPKFNVGNYVRIQDGSPCVITACRFGVYNVVCCENKSYTTVVENKLIPWGPRRGERVLIKDSEDSVWKEGIFSFQESFLYFIEGGLSWHYCVPFDENKLGKVTD